MEFKKKSSTSTAPNPTVKLLEPVRLTAPVDSAVQRQAMMQRELQHHTSRPVGLQRRVVGPVMQAATLQTQEVQHLAAQRASLQREAAALGPVSPDALRQAVQRQQAPAPPVPQDPQSVGDWVTVMRVQAEQAEGRWMGSRERAQYSALQRQVAQTIAQNFRQDRQPASLRHEQYAGHLAALQRSPAASVAAVALRLMPAGERSAVQRALDGALQREAKQQAQDAQALKLHSLQRQLEELEGEASRPVFGRVQARRGTGTPLPEAVRRHLEQGLNHDLSRVRIHDDQEADVLARKVNATAFTTGQDIYFRAGKFEPNSRSGLELLAHEVTHTVQQSQGRVGHGVDPDAGLENEARQMGQSLSKMNPSGMKLASGTRLQRATSSAKVTLQRQVAPVSTSPRVNQAKLSRLQLLLAEYRTLLRAGKLTSAERAKVEQAVKRAEGAIRSAEKAAGSGSSVLAAAGLAVAGAGGLAADDVTVIGVADDIAIPFVLLAAGALFITGKVMQTSPQVQRDAWKSAQVAVDAAVTTVGSTVALGRRRRQTTTRTSAPATPVTATRTERDKGQVNTMRFQVQWGSNSGGPTYSRVVNADSRVGVTSAQAAAALTTVVAGVTPKAAKEAAAPALAKQLKFVTGAPPNGITEVRSWSKYFLYQKFKDARVDVENMRGHNLRT